MEQRQKDSRRVPEITDPDTLVPTDHLLRRIARGMDYARLYEKLLPYYRHDDGDRFCLWNVCTRRT